MTATKNKTAPPEPEQNEDDLLDLTSLVPNRKLVKVPTPDHPEGETFELRLLDDFGVQRQQELLSWSRKFQQLFNSDKLRPSEAERMKHLLDTMFNEVLDAPASVKRQIPDGVRSRVVQAFSWAPQLAMQQAAAKDRESSILTALVERGLVSQGDLDEVIEEIDSDRSTTES